MQHSKLTGTQRCGFLLLKDSRSMTVELGLAITFRFRNRPGVPLEHGPGSRGFNDLPWVALTIPKYHLVTRLSLSNVPRPCRVRKWSLVNPNLGMADVESLGQHHKQPLPFLRPRPRLSAGASPGARGAGLCRTHCRGQQGEARNLVADVCYQRRPASNAWAISTCDWPCIANRPRYSAGGWRQPSRS